MNCDRFAQESEHQVFIYENVLELLITFILTNW